MKYRWRDGGSGEPPSQYEPGVLYKDSIAERDVMVPMRDGVSLCIDIYRPDTTDVLPALLAISPYNKESLAPEYAAVVSPQPSWSSLWAGSVEAGDTRYFNARGYIHVIGTARGAGKSQSGGSPAWDYYDLIEWIAIQPWCDGNIGMVGISAFGAAQLQAAALRPPHLKAIFPYDPGPAYREFRDRNPGGVLHSFPFSIDAGSVAHGSAGAPAVLPAEQEEWWRQAMENPDYLMYQPVHNIVAMKGQKNRVFFQTLINPYDTPDAVARAEETFAKIRIPAYFGTGWHAQTYKSHLQGAQHWYAGVSCQKKLMFTGVPHLERPFRAFHREILRWYDYWLKGVATGILEEPPIQVYVMGANRWLHAQDWPLPETRWTRFYLDSWERLRQEPFVPMSRDGCSEPDGFLQMPPTQTTTIQKLRYYTEPLTEDTLVIGPSVLQLFAAVDQTETNFFAVLKDVGPDYSQRSARPGETQIATDLQERDVTRGWLKASHRAIDEQRSKPWKPWHPMTREAQQPIVPGEITEYAIELMSTANLFRRGHRICLEISSMDLPTGIGGNTNVEYIPWHLCSSTMTAHKIYRDEQRPSHLLLPIIPLDADGEHA